METLQTNAIQGVTIMGNVNDGGHKVSVVGGLGGQNVGKGKSGMPVKNDVQMPKGPVPQSK